MIRVVLPYHLRTLAGIGGREVALQVAEPATLAAVLDVLEAAYPPLRGTVRDPITRQRRSLIRFFAVGRDLSHDPPDAALPEPVAAGAEPLIIVGAIAGG